MRNTFEAQIAGILANAIPSWGGGANDTERVFAKLIQDSGGLPMSWGWPDIAVFDKDNHLKAVVEVKPEEDRRGRWTLRPEQLVMLRGLASFGLPCFVWSPAGLIQIHQDGTALSVNLEALTGILSRPPDPQSPTPNS
jgi:hypothetical protein